MLASFEHRNKDIVFMVNNGAGACLDRVQEALKWIFDKGLESHDRISLITFAKNARIIFSLVDKEKNFTQLRNQIDRLKPDAAGQNQTSNIYKGLVEAVKEFKENLMPESTSSN